MVIINALLEFCVQLLSTPAVMIGLLALIGLIVQKKPTTDVIKGTVKTIMGFVLISSGAGIVISSITPLNELTSNIFNFSGIVPVNESCFAVAAEQYGTALSAIMALAMIINLVLARLTKFKFIYLTGHEVMWVSTVMAIVLGAAGIPTWQVIVGGALVTGTYMAVFPALIYKSVCKVTGTKDIAIGHTGIIYYWISAKIARLVGNKERSAEEVNVPKSLNFLRDLSVSLSMAMFVVYIIICLLAISTDPTVAAEVFGGTNFIIFSIMHGIEFAVAIYVIQSGVRMVVSELVPAFQGVAMKLIPGAVPALDIPILYPYQPNSVLIGFIVATIGGIIGALLQVSMIGSAFEVPIILPTLFTAFFYGGTFGALCNKEGGLRGVILGSFIASLVAHFTPAFLIMFGGVLVSDTTFGGSDSAALGILYNLVSKAFSGTGAFILTIILFLIPIIYSAVSKDKSIVEVSQSK